MLISAIFENVFGFENSNEVKVSGVDVGRIEDLKF